MSSLSIAVSKSNSSFRPCFKVLYQSLKITFDSLWDSGEILRVLSADFEDWGIKTK